MRLQSWLLKHTTRVSLVGILLSLSWTANAQGAAEDLRRAGVAAYRRNDLAEAASTYRHALRLAEQNQQHQGAGLDRISLGEIYHAMGRLSEARRAYETALPSLKREQYFGEVVIALTGLASLSVTQREFDLAVTRLHEATAFLKKIDPGLSQAELRTTNAFGLVYFAQGKYDKAEKYFTKAVALASAQDVEIEIFSAVGLVETLNNLASAYQVQRKYKVAEDTYNRALDLARSAVGSSHPTLAEIHFNLGSLYLTTNRLAEADDQLRRSLTLVAQTAGAPVIPMIRNLIMLGRVQFALGQVAEAQALLLRALELARKNSGVEHLIPDVLEAYTQVLYSLHRSEEAWSVLEEARRIRAEQAMAIHLGDLGRRP